MMDIDLGRKINQYRTGKIIHEFSSKFVHLSHKQKKGTLFHHPKGVHLCSKCVLSLSSFPLQFEVLYCFRFSLLSFLAEKSSYNNLFLSEQKKLKKRYPNTILSSCTPSISEPPFPQKTPKLNYIKSWGPHNSTAKPYIYLPFSMA